jgi:hypothetical protein
MLLAALLLLGRQKLEMPMYNDKFVDKNSAGSNYDFAILVALPFILYHRF